MRSPIAYEINNHSPEERKRFVRKLFDSIVPTYDLLNRVLSAGIDSRWRADVLRLTGDVRDRLVIDLCCGTGDLSRLLHDKGAKTVSIDFSAEMLRRGLKRKALQGDSILADACVIPFGSNTFDVATVAFGIRNIPDLDHFMEEVHRVLKPGGRLAILELVRPRRRVIRFLYSRYLGTVLPLVGGIVSGRPLAYRYLSRSIATFVDPPTVQDLLERHGLTSVSFHPRTLGIAAIIVCQKGRDDAA